MSRSVLIAGATGGLGSAIAADLAQRGATLTLVSRSAERLDALGEPGRRLAADLRYPASCRQAVQAAVEHGGRLDAVVNAVGVVAFGGVDELFEELTSSVEVRCVFSGGFLSHAFRTACRTVYVEFGAGSRHSCFGCVRNGLRRLSPWFGLLWGSRYRRPSAEK